MPNIQQKFLAFCWMGGGKGNNMKKLKVVRDKITERPDRDGDCIPIFGGNQDFFFMAKAHINGINYAHYQGRMVKTAEVLESPPTHRARIFKEIT